MCIYLYLSIYIYIYIVYCVSFVLFVKVLLASNLFSVFPYRCVYRCANVRTYAHMHVGYLYAKTYVPARRYMWLLGLWISFGFGFPIRLCLFSNSL